MKALTLWQPWASLIAVGAKTIETRSWSTAYRGPLAIHAAARRVPNYNHHDVNSDLPASVDDVRMSRYWDWYEHDDFMHGGTHRWRGPLGAVVATCNLTAVLPIDPQVGHESEPYEPPDDHLYHTIGQPNVLYRQQVTGDPWIASNVIQTDHSDQVPFGDFAPGRFAWLLDGIQPIAPAIAAKGHQGLWEWEGERSGPLPGETEEP